MKIIQPPTQWQQAPNEISVFLAGSIEQGRAEQWQQETTTWFANQLAICHRLIILNPRRKDWETMEQSESNKVFRGQVEWELDAQERADFVMLYFDPATKSPISLLELGLFHHKMLVCCPNGFWRKGNVDIVCQRYGVPMYPDLQSLRRAVCEKVAYELVLLRQNPAKP
jgi:hypothetical protein